LSLSVRNHSNSQSISIGWLSEVNNLTKLCVDGLTNLDDLTGLTGLISLTIRIDVRDIKKFLQGLTALKNLEEIRLWGDSDRNRNELFPSKWCPHLKKLKQLELGGFTVDADTFRTLATMQQLTMLHIRNHIVNNQMEMVPQLSFLPQLVDLELYLCTLSNPLTYILEGMLRRLRYLSLRGPMLSEVDRKELKRRLPCLRNFKYEEQR